MPRYPVKSTARAGLTTANLAHLCQQHFGDGRVDGPAVSSQFGALAALKVWVEGKELGLEVTMNPKVDDATQRDTIRRYNEFLQEATGYSAKERASKMRKSATKGADGK